MISGLKVINSLLIIGKIKKTLVSKTEQPKEPGTSRQALYVIIRSSQ